MKSDIMIAQETTMKPITQVAQTLGIDSEYLELYGKYKAKISEELFEQVSDNDDGILILVSAINPTPAGEGKTTTSIGLGQSLSKLGKKAIVALREPSLGPCMGVKGGACGGGYSQVVPMEDINLHFTGDIHAVTAANNLLSSMIDNHLHQGNTLKIDPNRIIWKRVMDLNDRALRNIVVGLGGKFNGVTREDGFMISVASEVMAILCLSSDIYDLKDRLGEIIIGYNFDGMPVTAKEIGADGAMTVLLKDALQPNLVQTLEHTPVLIHGGPFANIAHGCNSIRATKLALKLADYVVTEAGFGADLGAEKFFDIKCRKAGLKPSAVVLVATIRALKHNANVAKADLGVENLSALAVGFNNLKKHIENIQKYNLPVIVSLNSFTSDTKSELDFVKSECEKIGAAFAVSDVWARGGEGGIDLANTVINCIDNVKDNEFKLLYEDSLSIRKKIEKIAVEIYGASCVVFSPRAKSDLLLIDKLNMNNLPVCIAKTQYSLSDNPKLLGRPSGFEINVRELKISAGAGFIVALCGDIMTMPGLPKVPSAENIDIDNTGKVIGLF